MAIDSPRPLHQQPSALVAVFVGGVVGTSARYVLERTFPASTGQWPWATFGINLSGAALLGMISALLVAQSSESVRRRQLRLFAGTGCCGAFTTYSTFALEQTNLWRADAPGTAIAYAVVSVGGGVLMALAGFGVGDWLSGKRTR
ncbi:protein CrcB homolog [Gordonia effusa NBRC 100432]|uniref:Fluoride-specific ion channel FluC n=1 Tax=Gordonia effusa NBRC 100432 TaxID=1077974 RepID=H0QVG7_9ACTN|nr:fluoride efflux transporter CrcB [Gordonia effusa]GAB16844.1 protein CrcB homolog [Gordonia effusa NBRC 100432]